MLVYKSALMAANYEAYFCIGVIAVVASKWLFLSSLMYWAN